MKTAGARIVTAARNAADNDRSFRSWSCAEGLACQVSETPAHGDVLRQKPLKHDPEKWEPVFRKNHGSKQKSRDSGMINSKKSHHTLEPAAPTEVEELG